jgi:rhamnulokinase
MPARIAAFCRQTGQAAPGDPGAITRCILESLALKYRFVLDKLEEALGWRCEIVHIVGGGSKNRLLCTLTANATGRPVLAGPSEATTLGNAVIQAQALGAITSQEEGRQLIFASSELVRYEPHEQERWETFYAHFLKLKAQTTTLL